MLKLIVMTMTMLLTSSLTASDICLNPLEREKISNLIQDHNFCKQELSKLKAEQKTIKEKDLLTIDSKILVISFSVGVIIGVIFSEKIKQIEATKLDY